MSHRLTVTSKLLALLAVLALAALASAPTSGAAMTKWGDLGDSFGELESELAAPEPAFGVDPEDGSVWIVDHVGTEQQLRLQKFEKTGGAWKAVASHVIGSDEAPNEAFREVEGVAFDQKEKRAYLLVTEARKQGKLEEEQVASELLAFSTTTNGSKIEPASGTSGGVLVPRTESNLTGVPVGKKEFSPNSTTSGMTLFAPGGIAVNPANDQVVITGWVGKEEPQVWAVSKEGEIKTVWEDSTKFFEKCGCLTAPVVTSAGKILVLGDELQEITELPSNLSSATAPKQAFWLPRFVECKERIDHKETPCPFVENLTHIEDGTEVGGSMSIGAEGDVFVHVNIRNISEGELQDGGVMVLTPALEEVGWIGGGSWGSATRECAVNEKDPGNFGPSLVGGYHEHVFMFERGQSIEGEHAKVLELGAGGKPANCPQGSATKPLAEAGGFKLSSFPIADKVTLSSQVTQANALSTEWEFGDGVKQTVEKRQQEATSVEHQFKKEGTLKVLERIHSDDLATPEIEVTENIIVVAPKITGEHATPESTSATLEAKVNPTGSLTKCEFEVVEAGKEFSDPSTKKIACPTAPGEGEAAVTEAGVKATGLTPGKHYLFRLLAKAGVWESEQPGTEFLIAAAGAPTVETKPASEIGATSATLNGTVDPNGEETTSCTFEYGTALPSGKTEKCSPSPGSGNSAVAVSAKVTGLTGSTAYKFKLIAKNIKATGEGSLLSFTTLQPPSAPSVEDLAPGAVSQTSATLKALVNPHGEATTCVFEYGTSTGYGTSVPCAAPLVAGNSIVEEASAISGLTAGTTYHFRVTATNKTGTTQGADKEFETSAASGGSGPPTTTSTETPPPPGHEVLPDITTKFVPIVTLSGAATTVAANGGFSLKLSCPSAETSCSGAVTVKTLTAVAASSAHAAKAKKTVLTLATGSFSIVAGKLKVVSLHLTAKAKRLLARMRVVRARVTIVAHDPQGGTHTTTAVMTLKAAKKKH